MCMYLMFSIKIYITIIFYRMMIRLRMVEEIGKKMEGKGK